MKCIYCGKPCGLDFPVFTKDGETLFCCDADCKKRAEKALRFAKRFGTPFLVLIFACVALLAFGGAVKPKLFCPAGLIGMGAVLAVFPFCTPQTNQMFGLRKSFVIGRCLGAAVVLLGVSSCFYL